MCTCSNGKGSELDNVFITGAKFGDGGVLTCVHRLANGKSGILSKEITGKRYNMYTEEPPIMQSIRNLCHLMSPAYQAVVHKCQRYGECMSL